MPDREILDIDEVSSFLRIPKGTVYKMCERGKIPHFKAGRRLRFRKATVDKWIEKMEEERSKRR